MDCLEAIELRRVDDTLWALFEARVSAFADEPFLRFAGRSMTWRETAAMAEAWARHLRRAGCGSGDRVAVVLPNSDSQIVLLLACARAGLIFVPVNAQLSESDIHAALNIVQPTFIVAVDSLEKVIASRDARDENAIALFVDVASLKLPDRPEPTDSVDWKRPGPNDGLAIVFTSGTTGVPKGVVHSHRTYVLAAEIAAFRMRLTPADRLMVILPLFHLNALFYSVGGAIVCGGQLVIERRFHAATFWQTVRRHGVTQVNMIAAVGNILLKRDRSEFGGNDSLRKVSAAPVAADVAAALNNEFGIRHVVESYGMTEAPGIAQVDFHDQTHRACLGRVICHPLTGEGISEVRIVDDDRTPVQNGEIGRIMIRSQTMMLGYFNRPDLSDKVSPDGWFLTEDRGRVDGEGFHYFCGRTSELIRTRGENVAASEIEAALMRHPAISDAGCIGVPSELGEEDIMAVVSLRPGTNVDPAEVATFCAGQLSVHKRPRYLAVRKELPKTATEKVARHLLRDDPSVMAEAIDLRSVPSVVSGAGHAH